jgi:hypothetical protein
VTGADAAVGAEPPPQADRADTATSAQNEVMGRMKSLSEISWIVFHRLGCALRKSC